MVCSISLKESSGILALNINTDVWKIKNERKIVTNICDGECLRSGILSDHQHHLEWLALLSVRRVEVVVVVVAWWWCVWRGWVHFDPLSSAGVEYNFYYIGQWVARRCCWSRGHGCGCCWWQIHRRIHKVHVWLKIVIWKREKETKKKEKKKKKTFKGDPQYPEHQVFQVSSQLTVSISRSIYTKWSHVGTTAFPGISKSHNQFIHRFRRQTVSVNQP